MRHSILASLSAVLAFARRQGMEISSSDGSGSTQDFDYLEKRAIVTAIIRPYQPGQIFFRGSWWRAVCAHNVELSEGATVCVVGIRNLTYIVEPFV